MITFYICDKTSFFNKFLLNRKGSSNARVASLTKKKYALVVQFL